MTEEEWSVGSGIGFVFSYQRVLLCEAEEGGGVMET